MSKKQKKKAKCPAKQGVPPKEYQFKPGQSGNPKGPPRATTHLWRYFCIFMNMTDVKLASTKAKRLTQSQQAAMRLVDDVKAGKAPKSGRFAGYIVDRDLGRAKEHVQIDTGNALSDDECDSIRDILKGNQNVTD